MGSCCVPADGSALTTRLIHEAAAWDAIRPDWDALYAACPHATAPLDFAWLRAWWAIYGRTYGTGGLHIVSIWRGSRLIAALPLYVRAADGVRCLQFISTGEAEDEEVCAEYLDLLCRPAEAGEAAREAWRAVAAAPWDCVAWSRLASGSPLLNAQVAPAATRVEPSGRCPIADLTGGFDAYLSRLSANGRQRARRLMREGKASGARLDIADATCAERAFDDLCRLHQSRWEAAGQPGVFSAPRFVAFHRELINAWVAAGRAVLATLRLGPEPVAVLYGFVRGERFEFYQSGIRFDTDRALHSPGNLAHLWLMRELAGRGITAYDFLRGDAAYKERLATRADALAELTLWRSTARAAHLLGRSRLPSLIGGVFRWSGVLCLTYHRIGHSTRSLLDHELWSASPEGLDEQLSFLTSHFDVVTPEDLPDRPNRPRDRFVLVTFDDGYRDQYETAFPILRRHGVRATFFVSTGYVDRPRLPWWDEMAWMVRSSPKSGVQASPWHPHPVAFDEPTRARAVSDLSACAAALPADSLEAFLERLAEDTGSGRAPLDTGADLWMTWDMLRSMHAAGMVIGGHTVSHPWLARLTPDRQRDEIAGCADRLAAELGAPMRYFSYPYGQRDSFDRRTRAALQRTGVRWAFSFYGGRQRFEAWDGLDVRRVAVERYMGIEWFRTLVMLPGAFCTQVGS